VGFGRAGPAIQRLDPDPPHQRRHRNPADHHALGTQHVAQHPATRKRVLEMQRVDPVHDRQPSRRHRPRLGVDTAPAQPQQRGLPRHRQVMSTVDHRFALSRPALLSAPDKKLGRQSLLA